MSLSSSQRREQRRRLIVSWSRSSAKPASPAAESPRSMAAYDAEAHPEKQRGPAVLLPTGLGRLAVAITLIMLPLAAAIAASAAEQLCGRNPFTGGGRFARTLAAAGDVFGGRGAGGLQNWLAQAYLFMAAGVALIVRVMRRHRRDDYNGRFRAWGWLAVLFVLAALAGATPVGRLVAAAMTDATGTAFGPEGLGWWIALASTAVVAVTLWAVLPLHERLATGLWLTAGLVAWGVAAAATWLADGREGYAVAGAAAWSLASGILLVSMLVAARSVIREVRGQCGVKPPKVAKPSKATKTEAVKPGAESGDGNDADTPDFEPVSAAAGDDADTEYTDGSEHDGRHLSKAERKRLRKLARMNGAAA
jgi:hypothetical protein